MMLRESKKGRKRWLKPREREKRIKQLKLKPRD